MRKKHSSEKDILEQIQILENNGIEGVLDRHLFKKHTQNIKINPETGKLDMNYLSEMINKYENTVPLVERR